MVIYHLLMKFITNTIIFGRCRKNQIRIPSNKKLTARNFIFEHQMQFFLS